MTNQQIIVENYPVNSIEILLVEDDKRIAKSLIEDLRHQHHLVDFTLIYSMIKGI